MEKEVRLMNLLLLEATDSTTALANLHRFKKAQFDHWSMGYVCKKAGIPSTGYFSDVLKGKRFLHSKYLKAIQKTFGLSPLQGSYIKLLVERDQAENKESAAALNEELLRVSGLMEIQFISIPSQLSQGLLWHIIVLSSFSLFPEGPTLQELENFFGRASNIPLGKSLHKLQSMGLIEVNDSRYKLTKTRIIFKESEDGFSHYEFLEKSILNAANQVRTWFPKTDQSLFLSTIISANKKEFEAKLPEIRNKILAILSEMEGQPADQLLQFNLQAFPFDPQALNP